MDYISSVFDELEVVHGVITPDDELDKFCSNIPTQQPIIIPQGKPQTQTTYIQLKDDSKKRKITHREIERQRRRDMATLYGSLRSILPIDYIKGKRSISDHVQEAVKYIKHLEEKIQDLNDRKDELKKLFNDSGCSCNKNYEDEILATDGLTVKPCLVGVEVVVDTCCLRKSFPLSKVLQILNEEGLNIVSCGSTKVKERMVHTIKSEVRDGRCIEMSALEQKLTNSVIRPIT